MKVVRLAAVAFFALSTAALAQFEGSAEFRATTTTGRGETIPGHGSCLVSKNAVRMQWEMDLRGNGEPKSPGTPSQYRMTTILKVSEPDKMYMLNDEKKTYTVVDLKKAHESAAKQPLDLKVRKLGRDTVGGLSCDKAVVTSPSGTETEICVTRELTPSSAWLAAMNRERSGPLAALRANGLDGFPIRMITREGRDKKVSSTFELVRFEKKTVPASAFEVPAGYQRSSGSTMTPEQRKAMKDALSRMTPEQRKQYDEMMKKQEKER